MSLNLNKCFITLFVVLILSQVLPLSTSASNTRTLSRLKSRTTQNSSARVISTPKKPPLMSRSEQAKAKSKENQYRACTASVWICSEWNSCSGDPSQNRTCELKKGVISCDNPLAAKPLTTRACFYPKLSDAAYWLRLHQKIIDAGKELTRQGPDAKPCLRALSLIEDEYLDAYNNWLITGDDAGLYQAQADFNATPSVCF